MTFGRLHSVHSRRASRDGALRVVGELRPHLDRDEAVAAAGRVEDGPENVRGAADVVDRELLEDREGLLPLGRRAAHVLVVEIRVRDGLLEDRRVRRHPREAVLADQARQLSRGHQVAADVVVPDALAELRQLLSGFAMVMSSSWIR